MPKDSSVYEDAMVLQGGGLVWWWTLPNGWGFKWVWGEYTGQWQFYDYVDGNPESKEFYINYAFPFTFRKNFFYPSWFSPYIGITVGSYTNRFKNTYRVNGEYFEKGSDKYSFMASPSAGIELFSTKIIHIFIDGLYLQLPALEDQGEKHQYKKWIISFGMTTNW